MAPGRLLAAGECGWRTPLVARGSLGSGGARAAADAEPVRAFFFSGSGVRAAVDAEVVRGFLACQARSTVLRIKGPVRALAR